MDPSMDELARLFRAVGDVLRESRAELNASDPVNANHGDHIVEVFEIAARAAEGATAETFADAMEAAARQLRLQTTNGSAQVYASGLEQMALQFRRYELSLGDFLAFIRRALADDEARAASDPGPRSGEALKALVSGLVRWNAAESGGPVTETAMELGALFDLGIAYMQAKARGGGRSQVLADAAASASPLAQTPHRFESGKLALQALLDAIYRPAGRPELNHSGG